MSGTGTSSGTCDLLLIYQLQSSSLFLYYINYISIYFDFHFLCVFFFSLFFMANVLDDIVWHICLYMLHCGCFGFYVKFQVSVS